MAKGGGLWPEEYKRRYPSLEKMDPDSWMVLIAKQ